MTFADIAAGAAVFADANVFVFYSVPHATLGPSCRQFMERIARQEITGFTSADALSDVAHRVMTLEAVAVFGWSLTGVASHLKQQPSAIQQLVRFRQSIEEIVQIGIRVLPTTSSLVLDAARLKPTSWVTQRRRPDRGLHAGQRPDQHRQQRQRLRPRSRANTVCPGMNWQSS